MDRFSITVNGKPRNIQVDPDTPLLWVLREELNLTGSKFGCGIGQCGACTVLVNNQPVRSCVTPINAIQQSSIETIESLAKDGLLDPVQQAWLELDVPQCGYCQSGQIIAAKALLTSNSNPSDEQIDNAMTNICRCGTYDRIRQAIHRASELLAKAGAA